ncbi:MAG: VWA domain-containing protein [Phycisphaerales bacterium]|nr:VWA domain-containing protein [Phycisphaerales bacterium]
MILALTWLTPFAGAILASVVIPPLLALWFLKLRRKPRVVASTLLWTRSLADLRANAPFQRLRPSVLLFLQLLLLGLIAVAIAQPESTGLVETGGRYVLLIDRSASMNAMEDVDGGTRSRLEIAKDAALERVDALLGGGFFSAHAGDVMVVAFGARAEVRAPFTDNVADLQSAINAIAPTDEVTSLGDALAIARAFTTNVDPDRPDRTVAAPAILELYSDGRLSDLAELTLRPMESLVYRKVGTAKDNVAIVALAAERPADRPDDVQVFAALINMNTEAVAVSVQLAIDGRARAITPEPIQIPAAAIISASSSGGAASFRPGSAQVIFRPIAQPRDVVIEASILRKDALASDDVAFVVVPPAKRLRILLVQSQGFVLASALDSLPIERVDHATGVEFDALVAAQTPLQYDLVVLDNFAPKSLPSGRYLIFGAAPPLPELNVYATQKDVWCRVTRDESALLRSASFDELFVSTAVATRPSKLWTIVAEGPDAPLLMTYDAGDTHAVYVTFDLLDSNWPFQRSFLNFVANAVDVLGHAGEAITAQGVRPGDAIALRLPAGSADARLTGPDGLSVAPKVDAGGNLVWGPVLRTGLYDIAFLEKDKAERGVRRVASNLYSAEESRVEPVAEIVLGVDAIAAMDVSNERRSSVWPWVLGLALVILVLEWWVYQRQVRV